MMNRELMRRQMFAKGGAAFPDLSGDGRVTQKDILMGRGVIPMQDGGMAPGPMPSETEITLGTPRYRIEDPLTAEQYEEITGTPGLLTDESSLVTKEMLKRLGRIFQSEDSVPPRPLNEVEVNNAYVMMLSPKNFTDEEIRELATNPSGRFQGYQDGGMVMPGPMPAAPGPLPSEMLPVMPPVDPNNIDMGQVSQAAMQSGIDPVMLETMLTEYASGLDDLENAEDYETVMNGIRGDKQPIQQRYQELATVVGPEDAQQTPESVLTLVQPVMMLASVDQGIGSLAAEEMSAPVEGPMAEGIMSTVDMAGPEPMAAPAPMAEEPAPVNFNQGGAVQYFAPENPNRVATPVSSPLSAPVVPIRTLSEIYEQDTLPTYQKILGAKDQEKAFQDQKRMTEAQMLFDIAQGALMFATPGERRMSPAERLAQAFTPVLGNIGTRAGELQKFKQSQAAQDQALKLQALGSAEKQKAFALQTEVDRQKLLSSQAHDFAKMGQEFKYRKQENESEQDHQMRLADRRIEGQRLLTELQGRQDEKAILLRGQVQSELARLTNSLDQVLQQNRFDYTTSERLATEEYQNKVREQQFTNQKTLASLEFDNSKQAMEIKNRLEKEQLKLSSELRITENQLAFENQLTRDGIQNTQRILEMEKGFGQNQAIVELKAAIDDKSRTAQNEFTAAQKALDRAHEVAKQKYGRDTQLQVLGFQQQFKQFMQEEMQKFTKDQNKIDRAIREAELSFRKESVGDQLDIDKARLDLEEKYKLGRLALDRQAAKAAKLGSEATTNEIQYFTGPRLEAYENGKLDAEQTREFEQALLNYTAIKGDVWDSELGEHVKARNLLAPGVLEVVKKRNPALFEQITGPRPDDRPRDTLGSATIELFNLSKAGRPVSVNPESPIWKNAPTTMYEPDLGKEGMYREVVGLSRLPGGLTSATSEMIGELFNISPSEYAKKRAQAQADLRTFANKLLNYQTGEDQGGRVLKFVQLLIAEETDKMRAGGVFRTNADARATVEAIRGQLEQAMMRNAEMLPEYGGGKTFDKKSVLKARRDMVELKTLYNELLGFQEGFEVMPDPVTEAVSGRDQSIDTSHEQINKQLRDGTSNGNNISTSAGKTIYQMIN